MYSLAFYFNNGFFIFIANLRILEKCVENLVETISLWALLLEIWGLFQMFESLFNAHLRKKLLTFQIYGHFALKALWLTLELEVFLDLNFVTFIWTGTLTFETALYIVFTNILIFTWSFLIRTNIHRFLYLN